MSQKLTLEAFRQEIRSVLGPQDFTPPVEEVIEDFWNSYSELEAAIAGDTVSLSVDTLHLGSNLPEYERYHGWKGAGKILILLSLLLIWFQWILGIIISLVGFSLHKYGEHIRKADGRRFMHGLIVGVKQSGPGAMANLCAHYIAGSVELVSDLSRVCWPWYPSNVLTGRSTRVSPSSGGPSVGLPPLALERVSRELGPDPTLDLKNHKDMIQFMLSGSPQQSERALADLLDYCESNPDVRKVMTEFKATRETLSELYKMLRMEGAGQWANGHFVPASALAHPHTLRYLLEHPASGREPFETAGSLVLHFKTGSPLK